jgi:hypothetical protein
MRILWRTVAAAEELPVAVLEAAQAREELKRVY